MKLSERLTQIDLQTLISLSANSLASRFQSRESGSALRRREKGRILSDFLEIDVPQEYWFSTEQFKKAQAAGLSDAQLYNQAGNAMTVNVVETVARNLLKFNKEVMKCQTM